MTEKSDMEKKKEERPCPKCGAPLTTEHSGPWHDLIITTKCTKCDYTKEDRNWVSKSEWPSELENF